MNPSFLQLIVAFSIGISPIIIQIIFNYFSNKKNRLEKYGETLYSKQYDSYMSIYDSLISLDKKTTDIFIAENSGEPYYTAMSDTLDINLKVNYINAFSDFKKVTEKNYPILPNELLKLLYSFMELHDILYNTIVVNAIESDSFKVPNQDLQRIENNQQLKELFKLYEDTYPLILGVIRTLIGTDRLSNNVKKYVDKVKNGKMILRRSIANLD